MKSGQTMKRSFIFSASMAMGASSSYVTANASSSPQHLRGHDALHIPVSQVTHNIERALQDPNPDSRYCGSNWQAAYDACDAPCPSALDEDCGPGLFCFGFVGCTPAEPMVPVMPPNEYTPSASGAEPNPSPEQPAGVPSYIASLPLAPSEPTTPAPFNIPVPEPNLLPNPNSYYCGYGYESAINECYYACPSGKDDECPGGRSCHGWLSCNQAQEDPALYNVCGTTWLDASTKCATRCFMGREDDCPAGETCFGNVVECKENPNMPALTAEDVGQAPKMYTQEEIDVLALEEVKKEAEAAAMEDPDNWWCGTSWTNMLENCSKRCTRDSDCTVNSWETATCFKTPGGPGNCAIPGQPAKQASAPGSKWCGYTWNDMLETCSKQCEADEDCDGGKICWEAPGTCQYIGVPVKEVSDPATLWCGTSFDDAAVSCHKACPSESDDDCPDGMSCFAGSSCTEEGVPVVRENYRCGSSWEDAATKCGIECQKDDDCTVENGANFGDICYADVECVNDQTGAGSSGMMCVSNWEAAQDECATTNACATDDDCSGNTLCMWIDCQATQENIDSNDPTSGTNTPGTLPGCSAEVFQCSNGQYVARAPELNCEFYPCPEDNEPNAEAFSDNEDVSQNMVQNSEQVNDSSQVAKSQDVPVGWDTIPLTFASPKCEGECTQCQGDCNSDDDCAGDLKCFSRSSGEVTAVPGCVSGGEGDLPGMDYCYMPEPPTTTTTTTTTTTEETTTTTTTEPAELMSAGMIAFDAPELVFARECSSEYPCGACEGDCDEDSHCASGLLCFSRIQGSVEFVPGCKGMGIPGMDFCYNPNADIILPTTDVTTTSPPEQQEFSGCSAEVRACPGTTLLVYQNPALNCEFDPCPQESTSVISSTSSEEKYSTTAATDGGSTEEFSSVTSTQAMRTEPGAVTCDTLCLNELPASFCPIEIDNLPNCLNIEIGHICEASGECATSDSLNNCQTFDVYVRVECGGHTPTQGYLMNNPPVTTESPLTTSNVPKDDNIQQGYITEATAIKDEEMIEFNSAAIPTATIATADLNETMPEILSGDILSNSTLQTTESSPVPNDPIQENTNQMIPTLSSQTGGDMANAAAASFTYDRSPQGNSVPLTEDSIADFSAQDYSDADTWAPEANSQSSNPYNYHEGWDLTGYFTQGAESSASINSRGIVVLLGTFVAFAIFV